MPDDREYKVGYGKPPRHTQFKKGHSGNPKGRPKGVNNFSTDVKETLNMPVTVSEGGKSKKISSQRAGLMRLRAKALSGDARSLDQLLRLAQIHNNEQLTVDETALSSTDQAIIDNFIARQQGSNNDD